MIYSPREDSFLLQRNLKHYVKGKSVLDIGSGSGILAEAALKNKASSVTASDIDNNAIKLLKNKFQNTSKIKVIKSDLFSNIKSKFDVILFNPPYLPQDAREDKESSIITTGGKHGDELTLKFLKQAKSHLNKNGIILLITSSLTFQERILNLIKKLKFTSRVIDSQKLFMEELELLEIRN